MMNSMNQLQNVADYNGNSKAGDYMNKNSSQYSMQNSKSKLDKRNDDIPPKLIQYSLNPNSDDYEKWNILNQHINNNQPGTVVNKQLQVNSSSKDSLKNLILKSNYLKNMSPNLGLSSMTQSPILSTNRNNPFVQSDQKSSPGIDYNGTFSTIQVEDNYLPNSMNLSVNF